MATFTKLAAEVFAGTDGFGAARQIVPDDAKIWGTEVEAYVSNTMTTIVSGVGTISRTLEANIRDQNYNVMNYGAVAAGDLLIPLQKAGDAASAAGGGTVFVPAGAWTLSGVITPWSNVQIVGAGRGATVITCTSATAHMFSATSKNMMAFRDMTLDNSATKTAGSAFKFDTCSVVVIRNVEIANHIFPVEATNSVSIWFDEIEVSGLKASTGIGIIIDGGNDHYLRNVFIKTAAIGGQALAGINIRATGGTWLSGCGTLWCNDGLLINPGTGKTVEHIFSTMNAYDTGTGRGIRIAPTGTGIVRRSYFMQDWTCTNSEHGVSTYEGAGTVDAIFFIGHRALNNQKHGIYHAGGLNVTISEALCAGNSGAASNTYDGISVAAGVTDFGIFNCRSGAVTGFSNVQRYGINVASGASDRYRIIGNDTASNVSGGLNDGGSTIGKQVFGNLPVSAAERLRFGGANFYQPLASGWQLDSDQSSVSIASGAETVLTTGSGMLILTDDTTGGTGIFVIGGGAVALVGQVGTTFAATSTPSSSQVGVYYSAGTYRVKNGFAVAHTIYPGSWKTRPAN